MDQIHEPHLDPAAAAAASAARRSDWERSAAWLGRTMPSLYAQATVVRLLRVGLRVILLRILGRRPVADPVLWTVRIGRRPALLLLLGDGQRSS
jgi:hypothetical protein